MELSANVQFLKGVGEKRAKTLGKLGIFTVQSLLAHYPARYTDFSQPMPLADAPYGENCVVKAEIYGKTSGVRISGGRQIFKVSAGDDTGSLTITFFSPYPLNNLNIGESYLFYGKVNGQFGAREMASPEFILANSEKPLVPVYHLTQGITSKYIGSCVKNAFKALEGKIVDPMPNDLIKSYNLPDYRNALYQIHFPTEISEAEKARKRLIFDELFNLQIGLSLLKNKNSVENSFKLLRQDAEAFFRAMPFEPTDAQKRAVAEIYEDFKSETPANRLLQGDVGSGKTLVAAAGMVATAQSGYQSVLMAPTEILAVQHANTLAKLLKPFHLNIALLTASVKGKERTAVLKKIAEGEADIIVGTHAVLGDKVNFARLAFAVTDEQHRFGVRQRMQLANKAEKSPHVLVMSATPIPRTLGLLLFAELDISILDELPKGRQTVKTYLVNTALRARMFAFIEKHAKMGHQTFIVCPLVEESETMTDVMSLMTYYETIAKPMLPNCRVAVIHGKMKATEKAQIMQDFANKKYDVLCSTTVIEVGVDVPNATVMVIENAERYGVSSLHQLRGRVGRGNDESFCVLVSDSKSETAKERLNLLCKTHDGFKLAEYDMKTRGVGDFFGNRQHGLPTLKVANLLTDTQILYITQTEANKILKTDPNLENHPLIRQNVDALFNMDKGGVTY